MASFDNLDAAKGLLSLIDHYSLAKHLEGSPSPFQTEEVPAIIIEKGYVPAAKHLLKIINKIPADVTAIVQAYELASGTTEITAPGIRDNTLNLPTGRADLFVALGECKKLNASAKTKKALHDFLIILDYIDNDRSFLNGERPGAKHYQQVFLEKGKAPAIKAVFNTISEQDKVKLAALFEIEGELSPKALRETVLNVPDDDIDLNVALTKIDTEACSASPSLPEAQAVSAEEQGALIIWEPALVQEMDNHVGSKWQKASWSNGDPFNVNWQNDNVTFNNGIMILQLDNAGCPQTCDNKPYASGEYRSTEEVYGFGFYETRMKAAAGNGLVSSFFTYAGTYGQQDHHEIDFEVLGKNCNVVQTNYYVEGKGHHEEMIALGFNACEDFHNYGFKWTEQSLSWFIDGKEVRTVTASGQKKVPYEPGKIMVNFWAGIGVDGWLKPFTYPGSPLQAQYDWIRYSPLAD